MQYSTVVVYVVINLGTSQPMAHDAEGNPLIPPAGSPTHSSSLALLRCTYVPVCAWLAWAEREELEPGGLTANCPDPALTH